MTSPEDEESDEVAENERGVSVSSYAELLYLSAIRLLGTDSSGPPRTGTAFVVSVDDHRFLVTAAHVVRDPRTGIIGGATIYLYRAVAGPEFGQAIPYVVPSGDGFWHFHEDAEVDIAVGDFEPVADFVSSEHPDFLVNAISSADFAGRWEERVSDFTAPFWHPLPLDEVLIVGYPLDYRDRDTSLPLLRRGRLATPFWLNHEGRPVFLVDTYAGPGTSGGPVAYVEEKHQIGRTMHGDTGKIVLLGVFSEALPPIAPVAAQDGRPSHPPNVGAAYKAHLIFDVIASFRSRS